MTAFDTASFDLDAYLRRIGLAVPPATDVATLRAIALLHPQAIPFENLNVLLARPVPLDVPSLQQKLVRDGRGGWCFEHNVLLGTALRAIGFDVQGLAARVMWTAPAGTVTPRSHMVLHVDLDGEPYIVDAGFGGLTLTAPLRLAAGVEQATPHEPFRLVQTGDVFVLDARVRDEWKPLYGFDLQPQAIADYEVTSWYLATNPRSHFVTTLVAARVEGAVRYGLRNNDLATHHRGGYTERRVIADVQGLREVLERQMQIRVPAGADAVLERIIGHAASPLAT